MAATHKVRVPMADQIPPPNYGHHVEPLPKQDVVPIDIVPDQFPEQNTASQMHLDNSHTIEMTMKDIVIRIHNDASSIALRSAGRHLRTGSSTAHSITFSRCMITSIGIC